MPYLSINLSFLIFPFLGFLLIVGIDDGEAGLDGPIEDVAKMEAQEAERLLNHLCIPVAPFPYY